MANCKQRLRCHLLSAQQWLARAEQAFGKNRDVRGELDLFLAQAELQHARETNRMVHFRHKYALCRHVAALALALTLALALVLALALALAARQQMSIVGA